MKRGIWYPGFQSTASMANQAETAERAGLDSVWVSETALVRDAIVTLGAISERTKSITLCTGIVNPYLRHPAQIAAAIATLDETTGGGRVICGIGLGSRSILAQMGCDTAKPLRAMRESVEIIRGLLQGKEMHHHGRFMVEGVSLGFAPVAGNVPIFMAAVGPRMCSLAGEIADGIYFPYGSDDFVSHGLGRASDSRSEERSLELGCTALMVVDDDRERAIDKLRVELGYMLVEESSDTLLEANGLDPAKAAAVRRAFETGGVEGMAAAVDPSVVDTLAICGPVEHCRDRLRRLEAIGVTHVTVSSFDDNLQPVFEALDY